MSVVMSTQEKLLHSLLLEVRGLRRMMERRQDVLDQPAHRELLSCISRLLGDAKWTCDDVLFEAKEGLNTESARLRAALKELGIDNAQALGVHLRSRVGPAGSGIELKRHKENRSGARRWSVSCC